MRAAVHLVVIGALTGCLLSGCGGSSRSTAPGFLNMRVLAYSFRGQEYPTLHASAADGGPYEAYPTRVACRKTGSLTAACVLTFWPIRYTSSGYQYRDVKRGPSRFKVTVTIGADGRTISPSVPQKEGPAE